MKVSSSGQVGNWLWHFFAGVKLYGSVKAVQCCGCNWNEFKRGKALFNALLPRVQAVFGQPEKDIIQIHKHSCWQSLGSIPSREDCKRLINLPSCEPETRPVIHVRGGDYLRYFHQSASSITLSAKTILSLCERFGEPPENCVVVTDDPCYVRGLGIKFAEIRSTSTYDDWIYLANAERLAISPSTYSWWAGFLGDHK